MVNNGKHHHWGNFKSCDGKSRSGGVSGSPSFCASRLPVEFRGNIRRFWYPKKKCSWQGLFPNLVIPTFWQVSSSIFKYHVYLDRTINFLTSETRRWIPKEPAYLERSFTTCITQRLIHILLLVGHVPIVNLFPISVEFVLILLLVLESQLIPVFAL